ncbi:Methyltransf-2 domain-containing protein [Mycena kentingensis (nom. inval.)]|nr:Methyltransf-2 domain-containing protein [Mycena kentingensis (nom. inval.)]
MSRKRQRRAPDPEESRLEALLFGTGYSSAPAATAPSTEMHNLTDADLFLVNDTQESVGDTSESEATSDDEPVVSLESHRLRKLRDHPDETALTSRQYETRLRRQFERINPQPAWAKARMSEKSADGIDALLSRTTGVLGNRPAKASLTPGELAIERLRDANQAAAASDSGEAKSLAFHPSASVPLLAVGTADRRVRLFNVDGHTSPLLQTLHLPTLPLSQSSLTFHPSGSSLLLAGQRPFYFVYDLQRGEMLHKAGRGLWGSYDSTTAVAAPRKRPRGAHASSDSACAEGLEITSFDTRGEILAVAGKGGNIHLLDWKSGAGQVVDTLKCGASLRSMWWKGGGGNLVALTNDSEVYIWDVGERRCIRRWKDDGGYRGSARCMTGTQNGWLAVGSNTGLVNVYKDALAEGSLYQPKPTKTLGHLSTAVTALKYNHDGQVMAMASKDKKDALRLVHPPSLTAFSNWPTSSTPLGHITAIDFSPGSEYLAIGNTRGRVLLYHMLEYGAIRAIV